MRLVGGDRVVQGEIDFLTDNIKVICVSRLLTEVADGFLSDIPTDDRVSDPVALANRSISSSGGVSTFFADDVTFTNIVKADPFLDDGVTVYLYKDTGTESTSPLLLFWDAFSDLDPPFKLVAGVDLDMDWSASIPRGVLQLDDPSVPSGKYYNNFREEFMQGSFNMMTIPLKVVAVDATYTFSATDQFLSDIASGDRVATSEAIATGIRSLTNGTITLTGEVQILNPTGNAITQMVLYHDTGTDSTSDLIFHDDVTTHTPDGFDIFIYLPNSKLFSFPIFFA